MKIELTYTKTYEETNVTTTVVLEGDCPGNTILRTE